MRWLLLLLCLAFPRASSVDGCEQKHQWLWRVSGRAREAWFLGTLHVSRRLVRVGAAAVRGFDAADRVLFELDLTDPAVARALDHCQRLPQGTTLSDVLPGELYLRLKRHLDHAKHLIPQGRELYPDYLAKAFAGGWERRRPVWALLLLESTWGEEGRGGEVLDLWLARRALRMGKRAGAVERPHEHCLPLNALAPQQVVWALNRSLTRLEGRARGRPSPTEDLIRRYNCGDLDHFTLDSGEEGEVERYFRRELIEKRNARMAQRVVRMLRQHPQDSFFFAFGAGHFLGNGSVLDLVREAGGFQVERVTSDISPWGDEDEDEDSQQGAQLLRSVAPPPKHRHFNDLWVRMDRTQEKQSDQMADAEPSLASGLALDPLLLTLVVLAMIS